MLTKTFTYNLYFTDNFVRRDEYFSVMLQNFNSSIITVFSNILRDSERMVLPDIEMLLYVSGWTKALYCKNLRDSKLI